jgi:protein-tyrosine phosphatase
MKTLILCAANVCRSPAAEALWRVAGEERGLPVSVASAGLQARAGQLPSSHMSRLLATHGLVLPERGSSPFIRAAACRYELILVMEPPQQRQVLALAPELTGRVHLLGRWGQGPILDPTGGSPEDYANCFQHLVAAVDAWQTRLIATASRPATQPAARPQRLAAPLHA